LEKGEKMKEKRQDRSFFTEPMRTVVRISLRGRHRLAQIACDFAKKRVRKLAVLNIHFSFLLSPFSFLPSIIIKSTNHRISKSFHSSFSILYYFFFLTLFSLLFSPFSSLAQINTDTLQQVIIEDFPEAKYAVGVSEIKLDSAVLKLFQFGTMADLIQQATPVYIKGRGVGNLASISFRGTGAEHTAVLWNGININSPSLGQSDFYNLPNVGFSEITIHAGAGGALFGTDAIGGTINLRSKQTWQDGFELEVAQLAGSFGKYQTEVGVGYGKRNFELKTSFYRRVAENDFTFINRLKNDLPEEQMNHASNESWGITQDLFWEISKKQKFTFHAWYHNGEREIQPNVSAVTADDKQWDENLRLLATFQNISSVGVTTAKLSWVHDYMRFVDGQREFTPTALNRITGIVEHEKRFGKQFETKIGFQTGHFTMPEGNFQNDTSETRFDLYWLSTLSLGKAFKASLNLRQTLLKGFSPPFTPSIGLEYDIFRELEVKNQSLKLKATASKSFRVPTLNERFYQPGGNPDIKPEEGKNLEAGFSYSLQQKNWKLEASGNYFLGIIDNWVFWQNNGSFWAPKNIQQVENSGVETNIKLSAKVNKVKISIGGNYGLTKAKVIESDNEFAIGTTLPYVPEHKASAFLGTSYKGWQLNGNANFTGTRFTIGQTELESFTLFNLTGSKKVQFNAIQLQLGANIFNVLNTEYQNWEGFYMPRRSFEVFARLQI
jgi:vitamin B12 transporter